MDLLGKVVIGVDPEGPYARDALVMIARSGAAVALASGGPGGSVEEIANRIRRRGGKASVLRLAKEGWGGKLVRDAVAEFGRVDAVVTFASAPPAPDLASWRGFLAAEAARPADLLAGLKAARYPADGRSVQVIGVLLATGASPLTGAWEGLWRGIAASFTPEATGVRGVFSGLLASGVREAPGETVLAEGMNRSLALLLSDEGMPLRGQVIALSQEPAPAEVTVAEGESATAAAPVEKAHGRPAARHAAGKGPGYRPGRGTKQTR